MEKHYGYFSGFCR